LNHIYELVTRVFKIGLSNITSGSHAPYALVGIKFIFRGDAQAVEIPSAMQKCLGGEG